MNEVALKQPRRVLPRWRTFALTARLGELKPTRIEKSKLIEFDDEADLVDRWHEERDVGIATELLTHAILVKDEALALEVAQFIEFHRDTNNSRSPIEKLSLATTRTEGSPLSDPWLEGVYRPLDRDIKGLRHSLRIFPHNAIAWAELALLHAAIGQKKKASRCMKVAVSLAPDDRFVVRSAVRCFAHLSEHEVGLDFVNRTGRTKEDPWLLASQIALTQSLGKPQRLMRNATRMIKSGQYSPWATSELNAAVGSFFHHDGADKKANKLFRSCLRAPTENALCQVIFDQKSKEFSDLTKSIKPMRNFESETRSFYSSLELEKSRHSAKEWLDDEPFSARPALFGSFVAGIALDDNKGALKFIERGLKPNPLDPHLLNNKALHLARIGKTEDAEDSIHRARDNAGGDAQTEVLLTATEGLIHFRKGEISRGRMKYEDAIASARKSGRLSQEAMGLVFLAKEEFDAATELADEAISRAKDIVKKTSPNDRDIRITLANLLNEVKKKEESKRATE